MEKNEHNNFSNWSEELEDLIESGDTQSAISYLEALILHLETLISPSSQRQLSSALLELAKLYSSIGFSLKSDHARSRAAAITLRFEKSSDQNCVNEESRVSTLQSSSDRIGKTEESRVSTGGDFATHSVSRDDNENEGSSETCTKSMDNDGATRESSDDDWETMADRAPEELLPSPSVPEVSMLSLEDNKVKAPKRRGRGTFTYNKQGLYSDQQEEESVACDSLVEVVHDNSENNLVTKNSLYGTHHVLVLDGFHPSTTTTDLEILFEDFRDRGLTIRWVNDTLALAVFRSPSTAREACNSVHCSFSVRVLEEDDPMMSSISVKDLDLPRQRPKTSARTAQRLIAQELGVKLPSTFGSSELRRQEDARRSRIVTRQKLRDEAWGPDDVM